MTDEACTNDFFHVLKEAGVDSNPDWMSIILFARNLLPRLTIYTEEKKEEIQREVCRELARKDFSNEQYEAVLAMLDMYIMQTIGTLDLEEALAREKRSAGQLLIEKGEIIDSMQGANERQTKRLNSFKESTVCVIESASRKSAIVARVRAMFQELIQEFRDEAEELHAKANYYEQTANFDPLLTEMYNRRAFEAYLKKAVDDMAAQGAPLSLMLIDVDHFKRVNDTHGHQTGDDVLHALARIITAHAIHYSGFPARYGGEELVVVMKKMDLINAGIKAEAIRADVENYDFRVRTEGRLSDESLQFTVSIGVAELGESGTAGSLIKAADTAMYKAKSVGRNQVCVAEGT